LHLNYEKVKPFKLKREDKDLEDHASLRAAQRRSNPDGAKEIASAHPSTPLRSAQDAPRNDDLPAPKPRLIARKDSGVIEVDSITTLRGVPPEAWDYRLGTYSALDWVLERHKERTPKDPTIREKFNTYRFADYKEDVIDLLGRVCAVSVETVKIIRQMSG
jgi:predicted helicase